MDTIELKQYNYKDFLFDLIIYIAVMFLVREIIIPKVGFIANGLINSLTTLVVASWRMRVRGCLFYKQKSPREEASLSLLYHYFNKTIFRVLTKSLACN
jgi:hypothetical protein